MSEKKDTGRERRHSADDIAQEGPSKDETYLNLRSRKIYKQQQPEFDLSEYLSFLYSKAKETDKSLLAELDLANEKISKTREIRLNKVENIKKNTEIFKNELKNFSRLTLDNKLESKIEKLEIVSEKVVNEICENNKESSETELKWLIDPLENSVSSLSPEKVVLMANENNPSKMSHDSFIKVAKLTAQLIPIFSGEPHNGLVQELQSFLGCCNQVLQCLEEDEVGIFLKIFPSRLRGNAFQLVNSTCINTFKDAENLLNQVYLPRETYKELVSKLNNCKQQPFEPFITFVLRVKHLLSLCKEIAGSKFDGEQLKCANAQLEEFAISTIKSGSANPYLAQYLFTLEEKNIENLIKKALDMEKLQQSSLSHTFTTAPTPLNPLAPPYEASPYNTFSQTPITNTTAPIDCRNTTAKILSRISCSFCKNKGHTYDECIKRKNTPFCINCNRSGHDVTNCRTIRYKQANNDTSNRKPQNSSYQNNNNHTNYRHQFEEKNYNFNRSSNQQNSNDVGKAAMFNIRVICNFCGRKGHEEASCQQKVRWLTNQGNDQISSENPPTRH